MPASRGEREAVLRALAALEPAGCAVVKLRAGPGEQQTHHEVWPYPRLWQDLVRSGEVEAHGCPSSPGSLADALATARALVTRRRARLLLPGRLSRALAKARPLTGPGR